MKRKRLITTIIIVVAVFLFFSKAIVTQFTKNFEKDLFVYETDDFKIEMAENLSMGCAKHDLFFGLDTISIRNYPLQKILLDLSQKNINTSNFINFDESEKKEYNFTYRSKDSTENYKTHLTDILDKIGKEFNFNYHYDSIERTIYHPHINNPDKLKQFATKENTGKYRPGKKYFEFMGNNMTGIFRAFKFHVKGLLVENGLQDSSYYKFKIPSTEKNGIISFLDKEIGITFTEATKPVEVITFTFE